MKTTQKKTAKKTTATTKRYEGFTDDERAAMADRVDEMKLAGRPTSKVEAEELVLAKIAELPEPDRTIARRVHAIVRESAPSLEPKLWYGMPAYARNGKVVCFFQAAAKFKYRYSTFGIMDEAHIDEGTMWPTAFALTKLTAADEARIAELVKKA